MLILKCPKCGIDRNYKSISSFENAARNESFCVQCRVARNRRLTDEKILLLNKLYQEGLSNCKIAKQLDVHSSTVGKYLTQAGLKANIYKTLVRYELKTDELFECTRCNKELPANKFQYGRRNTAGEYRYSYCNDCRNKKIYLNSYKDLDSYLKLRLAQLGKTARTKDLPFNLTFDFIKNSFMKQQGKCFYTGLEMLWERGKALRRNTLSFDRVDNHKGYTMDNVVLCVFKANHIKCDLSFEELKEWLPNWYQKLVDAKFIN